MSFQARHVDTSNTERLGWVVEGVAALLAAMVISTKGGGN